MGLIFFLYPTDIIESVNIGHWLPILTGFAIHLAVIAMYMKGMSYFPRMDLVDGLRTAGNAVAIVLLLPVAAYLVMICVITIRAYSEVVTIVFLSSTPLWAIMALLLSISTYVAMLGIEAIFRTALLLFVLFIPLTVFILSYAFQNVDWLYALPVMDTHTATFAFVQERSFLLSLFAFSGGFLFLGFVQPHFRYKSRSILWSSLILLPLFLLSVYLPVLTFGQNTAEKFQFPFIMTVDTISIDWLMFDRISMFFLLSMITFVILFLATVMWKLIRIIRFKWNAKPAVLIPALSVALFVTCMNIPDWKHVSDLLWWNTFFRIYVMVIIPAATIVIGVRYRKRRV
ncbi:hypothetical protein D3P08_04285 [Paenibacillus nanensis]|uniref:Uncharacterized protein n=2 Tax=Paenibacillus nanensis TaxID=393251 RepID=A0A3A1VJD6_9BACL|nr:hypothetical protein D3P08_04285 [Paenibacillus nanensis]